MQSTVISTLPIILDNCQNEASTDLHHMSDVTLSQLQVLDEVRRFFVFDILMIGTLCLLK